MKYLSEININSLITVLGTLSVAYILVRQTSSKVASEVITAYKVQVEQYKEQVKTYNEKVNDLTGKIGHLEGTLQEKNKQIDDYKSILQNRNPELEKILSQIALFMEKIDKRLQFSETELKLQTKILKDE